VTCDVEKSHFVFERAGGNIATGEIISANDEQVEEKQTSLVLRVHALI
jgi:hypothetical protein